MKRITLTITIACMSLMLSAQDSEFREIIAQIKDNLMEVQTGDETYTHELEHLGTSVLKYTLIEVDVKGNREELTYEFNVADLDPYVVREETNKDIINLNMTVDNGQKFIKVYENGEVDGYKESMAMVTKDIDNARILKDLFKQAIPIAENIMSNKLSLKNFSEMSSWLADNVVNAEAGSKTFNQDLVVLEDYPANFRFVQTEIGSRSSEEKQYIFNLADININSLRFNITGSSFSLDFETNRKQKLIKVLENGAPVGFDDEIEIFTNNVEEARDIKTVLTMASPLAEETVQASIEKYEQQEVALKALTALIENIDYGDENFQQSVEGDCIIRYKMLDVTDKSTDKNEYFFNLIDINQNVIDVDVSSNKMYVEILTKESLKLVKEYEDDEHDGYGDEIKIYAENIEKARRLKSTLQDLINICERDYQDPFVEMETTEKISWLVTNPEEVRVGDKTVTQTFERPNESDLEKIKVTKLTVDAKGSTEEIYEFNFTDLNPKSITYDVGGKNLSVAFETMFKEDIIKHYKDGEIENYQDEFELNISEIEKARNIIAAFNQIIAELNE